MPILIVLFALVVISLADLRTLAAQSCFAGHPLPRCRSFWLTEAGLSVRLDPHGWTPSGPETESGSATLELGYMVNLSPRSALGAAVFLRGGEPVGGIGFRPRYRRWFNNHVSLDVAPGLVLKTLSGGQFTLKAPTFSGQVGLNLGSGLALTGQVDVARNAVGTFANGSSTDVAWYAGGRLGSGVGVVGILGFLALGALVAATW
jgi:hypothetical protein